MSPPLLGVEEGGGNTSTVATSPSIDGVSHDCLGLKERNYLGLSDCSSVDSSAVSSLSDESKSNLNLKATELRLGLPGSLSPEREPKLCLLNTGKLDEKPLFPLLPSKDGICLSLPKNIASGNKRGFSDTIDEFPDLKSSKYTEGNWMFHATGPASETAQSGGQGKFPGNAGLKAMLPSRTSGAQSAVPKEALPKPASECPRALNGTGFNQTRASNNAPAAK